jgi:hypothetical protein
MLSEIPEHLQQNEVLQGHKLHTYAEFHIDDSEQDELTLWLLSKYPTLKRKISFLIHIDYKNNDCLLEDGCDGLMCYNCIKKQKEDESNT